MNPNASGRIGAVWFVVAIVAFLAAATYTIVAVSTVEAPDDAWDDLPLPILGVVGVISLAGWWRERAKSAAAEEEGRRERERLESELEERENNLRRSREQLEATQQQKAELEQTREQLQFSLKEREEALQRERYLRSRSEDAYRTEKNWRRELHAEVMQTYREQGSLTNPRDIPSMVLRLAKTLLEAEKGLLLWRQDEGSNGSKLGLAASEGFEHDPENSAIVRRFAEEVFENVETRREENPAEAIQTEQRTEADEEIYNLVAIPIYVQDKFDGVVVCANNPDGFDDYDDEVLLSVGDQSATVLQNARLQGELRAAYLATVIVLADAIEVKDPFLRGHSEEVSRYVAAVADHFNLPRRRREELLFGSLLHDIGKIGISERILLKPTELTQEEFEAIKLHPRIGYRLVQQVPALSAIAPAILHHHERFDGGGYPSGLQGEDIPLEARIICVADSFSAMISDRPYRGRMSIADACAELERCAGSQFDPEVVRVFVEEVRRNPLVIGQDFVASLADPELEEIRRKDGEPVLGYGTLALTDNLTLLYTRRYFHEFTNAESQRAAARGRPFGIVLVELTKIDRLNQQAGYAAGDKAIQTAARAVQAAAARCEGTAFRYGGHRLALVAPGADEEDTKLLASEISADLKEGPSIRTATASWRPGDTGDAVISRARAFLS